MEALPSRKLIAATAAVAWALLVALGIYAYVGFAVKPGERGTEPSHWPAATTLTRSTTGPTLVMFVHPTCPCTRASVAELASIAATTKAQPRIIVVFVTDQPGGRGWKAVSKIDGVERVLDPDELEAGRFGARTSGYVVVYDRDGQLAYAGGITGSRGHEGDNMGKRSVLDVLEGMAPINARYGVFGCVFAARGPRS